MSNHDELMSNFFAQPDTLSRGKTPEEFRNEKVVDHKLAKKWTRVLRTGSIETKFTIVDFNTVMSTTENGQKTRIST